MAKKLEIDHKLKIEIDAYNKGLQDAISLIRTKREWHEEQSAKDTSSTIYCNTDDERAMILEEAEAEIGLLFKK